MPTPSFILKKEKALDGASSSGVPLECDILLNETDIQHRKTHWRALQIDTITPIVKVISSQSVSKGCHKSQTASYFMARWNGTFALSSSHLTSAVKIFIIILLHFVVRLTGDKDLAAFSAGVSALLFFSPRTDPFMLRTRVSVLPRKIDNQTRCLLYRNINESLLRMYCSRHVTSVYPGFCCTWDI